MVDVSGHRVDVLCFQTCVQAVRLLLLVVDVCGHRVDVLCFQTCVQAVRKQQLVMNVYGHRVDVLCFQTCVQAVRSNWRWMFQVMQCAEVHLRNAAAYHEVGDA